MRDPFPIPDVLPTTDEQATDLVQGILASPRGSTLTKDELREAADALELTVRALRIAARTRPRRRATGLTPIGLAVLAGMLEPLPPKRTLPASESPASPRLGEHDDHDPS